MSGFDRLMQGLKSERIGLPERFSAHVLRHDWNDRFSDDGDKGARRDKQTAEDEADLRAYLMGWKSLDSARWYTKRWTAEAANKRLLRQQSKRSVVVRGTELPASRSSPPMRSRTPSTAACLLARGDSMHWTIPLPH